MTAPTPRTMQSCAVWLDGEDGERILAVPLDTAELFLAARDAELASVKAERDALKRVHDDIMQAVDECGGYKP